MGFRLYGDGRIGVAPKAIAKLKDEVRGLWDARQSLTAEQLREQWRRHICGWWNYFTLADWRREVGNLSGWIRRHMRKCLLRAASRRLTPAGMRVKLAPKRSIAVPPEARPSSSFSLPPQLRPMLRPPRLKAQLRTLSRTAEGHWRIAPSRRKLVRVQVLS